MGGNTNRPNMPGQFQQFAGNFPQAGNIPQVNQPFSGNFASNFAQGNFQPGNRPQTFQGQNYPSGNFPMPDYSSNPRYQAAIANMQPQIDAAKQQAMQQAQNYNYQGGQVSMPNLPTLGGPTMPLITNGLQQAQTALQNLPNGAPQQATTQLANVQQLLAKLGLA